MASTSSSRVTVRRADLDDLDLVVVRRLDFLADVRDLDRANRETEFVNLHVDADRRGTGVGRPLYESVGFREEPGWMSRLGDG